MSNEIREIDADEDPGPYGSSFDDFLAEHGIPEETHNRAVKSVLAWQLGQALQASGLSKSEFARRLQTSRSQVERLLDPDNDAVTIETLRKAAGLLGKSVRLELVDNAQEVEAEDECRVTGTPFVGQPTLTR